MDIAKKIFKSVFQAKFSLYFLMIITFIYFSGAQGFATGFNIMNILKNASYMAIMVVGVAWVIAADEMDASFPDVAACASMVFAYFAFNGTSIAVAAIIALISGLACGALTSLLVVRFKFHSLITTIGVATIAKSIAAALNGGSPLSVPVIRTSALYKFVNMELPLFGLNIPVIFLFVIVLYAGMLVIQEKTKFGQYIYAMGENRLAVKEAGVKEGFILTAIFMTSAVFAALAGILLVLMVYNSGQPNIGSAYFLDGFTVVFLGAMVFKLGKTNVVGAFLGAIMLMMVRNGLTMVGASFATGEIVKGLLLVLGIVVVALNQRKRKGKAGMLKFE